MAISESSRLLSSLAKEGVPVKRVICNQVLPPSAQDCKFCAMKRKVGVGVGRRGQGGIGLLDGVGCACDVNNLYSSSIMVTLYFFFLIWGFGAEVGFLFVYVKCMWGIHR